MADRYIEYNDKYRLNPIVEDIKQEIFNSKSQDFAFEYAVNLYGFKTDIIEAIEFLGCSKETVERVRCELIPPVAKFIDACMNIDIEESINKEDEGITAKYEYSNNVFTLEEQAEGRK